MVIMIYALMMTGSVLLAMFLCRIYVNTDVRVVNNVAFLTLTASQLFHVFNMSSLHSGMLVNEVTKNRFIWIALLICFFLIAVVYLSPQSRDALNLAIIPFRAWLISGLASMLPLILVQVYKLLFERSTKAVIPTTTR